MSDERDPLLAVPVGGMNITLAVASLLTRDVLKLDSDLRPFVSNIYTFEGIARPVPVEIEMVEHLYRLWSIDPELGVVIWCYRFDLQALLPRFTESIKDRYGPVDDLAWKELDNLILSITNSPAP